MVKESFFNNSHYRLNKIFLSRLGTWPEQSLFMRCLLPFLHSVTIMSLMIPVIIRLSIVYRAHDVDTLLDCIPPVLVLTVSLTQLLNGSINHKMIHAMINRISSDWERLGQSPNIEILHKYATHGSYITRIYVSAIYVEIFVYFVAPTFPVIMDNIVPLNESRKTNVLFEAEYGVNADDYYWPIFCHSCITAFTAIAIVIWNDVMLYAMVEHACALFEIVGLNLKMVKNTIANTNLAEDAGYKMICHCIDLHREAITFAEFIEDSYSTSLVGVIGLWLVVLSVSGVQTIMHLDEPHEMLRYGSYSIVQIFHLYFNSLPGQKLMDYSQSVFEDAYADNWDGLSIKAQKLLLMMMKRSQRPCQITAGKIYVISMESYCSLMKTSMSYFTVLSSMR